ncbi:MAG: histidine phosphatase family protein [Desulfobacteraceae bacterium]|nr:MAG: histidine phosphatase family protein [Desulfobacteraceae bacterium]
MSMIYMIRHGQASFGQDDYDRLSPLGRKQARILAQFLFRTGFLPDAVYSGTMLRQKETAEEFLSVYRTGGRTVCELQQLSGFNEFDSGSIVEAMFSSMSAEDPTLKDDLPRMASSMSSFKRVFEGAMLRWVTGRFDTPSIETWKELEARVAVSLQKIREEHGRGKNIAVFTSGGAIAASLAYVLGIPGEHAIRLNWQVVNTSVTRYMYNEERITLAGFNSISHLEMEGEPSLITYR